MNFKEFYLQEKNFKDIILSLIKDLKKNKKKIIKETFGDVIVEPSSVSSDLDYNLLYVLDLFKKHFGKIGSIFNVSNNDNLDIPVGKYKILNYKNKKHDFDIKLQKIGEKNPFKKTLKIHLKKFLNKAGIVR